MANEFNQLMIERSENEEQLKLAAQFFIEAHDGIFIMKPMVPLLISIPLLAK